MAKLSARGRTTLLRLIKEESRFDEIDRVNIQYTTELAYMSDGVVLKKLAVRDPKLNDGKKHSYGWEVYGRYTTTKLNAYLDKRLAAGWRVVTNAA